MGDFSRQEEEEEEEATQRRRTNSYNSPCNCFQMTVKAFLKCLGLDDSLAHYHRHQSNSSSEDHDPPSTTTTTTFADEQGMNIKEDDVAVKSSILINFIRRPPRPPITSGRGGQIN